MNNHCLIYYDKDCDIARHIPYCISCQEHFDRSGEEI